ncbi:uncharacterized protein LOC27208615 [Drosophila simulans]|uniref:Seminal fluid protein n=1 Tax=Drosophila simulans TaxID=7240 RepID=A0A0J9TY80_DROSI|nr:uncharacterized protein LOC27208615 [Drosophila simulans]KMY92775.1 uncharacterized protein Dsimw501_GD28770 [Drosophila simulans]
MRNTAGVFLFLTFLIIVRSLKKDPAVNYCTLGVVLIKHRMMCSPLRSLWVLRKGKCVEALHCMDGYSKKECRDNCLKQPKKKKKVILSTPTKPQIKTKEIQKTIASCATTEVEIKTTTEHFETPGEEFAPSTRETRRPKRTRRTRQFTIKQIC